MNVSGIVLPAKDKQHAEELAGSAWTRDINTYVVEVNCTYCVVLEIWRN